MCVSVQTAFPNINGAQRESALNKVEICFPFAKYRV